MKKSVIFFGVLFSVLVFTALPSFAYTTDSTLNGSFDALPISAQVYSGPSSDGVYYISSTNLPTNCLGIVWLDSNDVLHWWAWRCDGVNQDFYNTDNQFLFTVNGYQQSVNSNGLRPALNLSTFNPNWSTATTVMSYSGNSIYGGSQDSNSGASYGQVSGMGNIRNYRYSVYSYPLTSSRVQNYTAQIVAAAPISTIQSDLLTGFILPDLSALNVDNLDIRTMEYGDLVSRPSIACGVQLDTLKYCFVNSVMADGNYVNNVAEADSVVTAYLNGTSEGTGLIEYDNNGNISGFSVSQQFSFELPEPSGDADMVELPSNPSVPQADTSSFSALEWFINFFDTVCRHNNKIFALIIMSLTIGLSTLILNKRR